MRQNQPIGVFDSGVGGISVLKACVRRLPRENFIFFGDSAHAPYGEKSLAQVRALTFGAADRLLRQGVKAMVVACNTATSAAITPLRQAHPALPIVGIEPALKPAALAKEGGVVLVMATPLTIREDKYQRLVESFAHQAHILSLPCKGLAERIEGGNLSDPALEDYLTQLLAPYRDTPVDAIVLGCTHYPFVREGILRAFGRPVALIDGSEGTARRLHSQLEEAGLLTTAPGPGAVTFQNSLPGKIPLCQRLFQQELEG